MHGLPEQVVDAPSEQPRGGWIEERSEPLRIQPVDALASRSLGEKGRPASRPANKTPSSWRDDTSFTTARRRTRSASSTGGTAGADGPPSRVATINGGPLGRARQHEGKVECLGITRQPEVPDIRPDAKSPPDAHVQPTPNGQGKVDRCGVELRPREDRGYQDLTLRWQRRVPKCHRSRRTRARRRQKQPARRKVRRTHTVPTPQRRPKTRKVFS